MPRKRLSASIRLDQKFDEAIAWAGKRDALLPDEFYSDKQIAARRGAFTVSGIQSVGKINEIMQSLSQALEKGESMQSWRNGLAPEFLTLTPAHREVIFRNAVQSSYAAGRWAQQQRGKELRPILMYDAVNDSRTRPAHRALDNFMAPVDDPVWKKIYPPNGHNCRCTVLALTEKQARARGWTGQVRAPAAEPDEGWDFNPGEAYDENIAKVAKKTEDQATLQIKVAAQARDMIEEGNYKARDYVLGQPDSVAREYGAAMNPHTGQIDAVWKGDSNSIAIPNTEANQKALKGVHFFHNHPSGGSLSNADFVTTSYFQMAEIHAVTLDGSWYRGRAPKLEGPEEVMKYRDELASVSGKLDDRAGHFLLPLIESGKIRIEDANVVHWHVVNEALAAAKLTQYDVLATGTLLGQAIFDIGKVVDLSAVKFNLGAEARKYASGRFTVHADH